jgi:hypothetical protein
MFCCFNWALVLYTWFFIKETKGLSLEEMDICELPKPTTTQTNNLKTCIVS